MIDISSALTIPGWMEPDELEYLAHAASKSPRIVEIGSWQGRSARALVDNTDGVVICVDTWDNSAVGIKGWWRGEQVPEEWQKDDWLYRLFCENLKDVLFERVFPIRVNSLRAAKERPPSKADFIFIDADHSYEAVKADILAWRKHLAPNGILAGHDYGFPDYPGVKQAVDELVGPVRVINTIWTTEAI